DRFFYLGAALQRSCDQQFNACANETNAANVEFMTIEQDPDLQFDCVPYDSVKW
ncbi:hypothetical protein BDU57DRAFT_458978, partial [Ampelomyces quisqualis]